MGKVALLVVSLLVSSLAYGATWQHLFTTEYGGIYRYDKDSVKVKKFPYGGKYLQVWVKVTYATEQRFAGKSYYSTKTKWELNCANDRNAIVSSVDYGLQGNVVDSYTTNRDRNSADYWHVVIPDTVGEDIYQKLCTIYRHRLK